jgi:hypothetical protein
MPLMRPLRWLPLCAVVLAAVVSPRAAVAGERERVAILEIIIEGDAPAELRKQLDKSFAGGLYAGGYEVVPRDEVAAKLRGSPELVGCLTSTCLERVADMVGTRLFARARVTANGAAYTFEIELLSADHGDGPVRRVERTCPVCTIDEANEMLSDGAAELSKPESEVKPPPGDGDEKPDGEPKREPIPPRPPPRAPRFTTWKWVTAGGAGVALVAGVWLIAKHGDGTDCPDGPPGTQCRQEWDTAAGGVTLSLVGVAAGAAATWMFLDDRKAERERRLHLGAAPLPEGGLGVWVGGRF